MSQTTLRVGTHRMKLNTRQKRQLLKLGLSKQSETTNRKPRENSVNILLDLLGTKLPLEPALADNLPVLVQAISDELPALSGPTLGDYLTNPKTSPTVLRKIKDYTKGKGGVTSNVLEEQAIRTIYHAAIAAGLVFQGIKISGHSYQTLGDTFAVLGRKRWTPLSLKRLFRKAGEICDRRK
jgi:hypothetical protein